MIDDDETKADEAASADLIRQVDATEPGPRGNVHSTPDDERRHEPPPPLPN